MPEAFFFLINGQVILKLVSQCKEPITAKIIWKRGKMLDNLLNLISITDIKLQKSAQYGMHSITEKQINAQK